MASQDRINQMKANMLRCIRDEEIMAECRLDGMPARMLVSYHDGPGIQFMDSQDRPMLPDFLRDEEQAITLWNALTNGAPIDPAWFGA